MRKPMEDVLGRSTGAASGPGEEEIGAWGPS
jgi:hypothetical protein